MGATTGLVGAMWFLADLSNPLYLWIVAPGALFVTAIAMSTRTTLTQQEAILRWAREAGYLQERALRTPALPELRHGPYLHTEQIRPGHPASSIAIVLWNGQLHLLEQHTGQPAPIRSQSEGES